MANKVVYNACFGGFGLSKEGKERYVELTGCDPVFYEGSLDRHDPALVQVVEELGDAASGFCGNLQIEEIEGSLYRISEYDGSESVETPDSLDWVQI
jgi:hypothetical protein